MDALQAFDEQAPVETPPVPASVRDDSTWGDLGQKLHALYTEAQGLRREQELIWLADFRQYKGEYEPEQKAKMHPLRSQAFIRLTRTKVRSTDARMADMMFPSGDKNWSIAPPKAVALDGVQHAEIAAQVQAATGQPPDPDLLLRAINDAAQKRCDLMSLEMEDQLRDGNYQAVAREVMHSGHVFGTGILKGPLVERKNEQRWVVGQDGNYQMQRQAALKPYFCSVSLWDLYPDMSATRPEDLDYLFERHVMTKADVRALAKRKDFNGAVILDYLKANPEGDAKWLYHEQQLNAISNKDVVPERRRKYDVLEYWGYLDGQELKDAGVDIPDDQLDMEVEANVWLLGDKVIKAVLNPTEQQQRPYHWYYFEKDDNSIFGIGISSIMRDPQQLFNSAIRLAVDNAAISAGPQIEYNLDLLAEQADISNIYPFKLWPRTGVGAEANFPAIRVFEVPSHVQELLNLANVFKEFGDEATAIPAYVQGENIINGAGDTASGLSMLMGQANITLKDLAKNYDEGITVPFIAALYHWNMQFNPNEAIKGDYDVTAQGSQSLVTKEVRARALEAFAASTLNPLDAPTIDRLALNRKRAQTLDLGDGIVKDNTQMQAENQGMATPAGGMPPGGPGAPPNTPPGGTPPLSAPGQQPGHLQQALVTPLPDTSTQSPRALPGDLGGAQ